MKKLYVFMVAMASFAFSQEINAQAQCSGVKGPNLLGAKGTFSTPAVTPNTSADPCLQDGTHSYNPVNNIGNALSGCSAATGAMEPCSDYEYAANSGGLQAEGKYSLMKVVGDASGGNCIKSDWKGSDHTGDGGYFMVVNGAPNNTVSPTFYRIKNIPVCPGATYEFSAWVVSILPATNGAAGPGSEPNISFVVNGTTIATSGPIAYTNTPVWIKVGGVFTATTSSVDLEVVNATAVASGNDLGIDDISINLCGSNIDLMAGGPYCDGQNVTLGFNVTDASHNNSWYQLQQSTDGGANFFPISFPAQASFTGDSYTVNYSVGTVTTAMNGFKYRLVVSTSAQGTMLPDCGFFNEHTLIIQNCGPLPVQIVAFNGKYSRGISTLDWNTSQEVNSKEFELQRSFDGRNFEKIASIAGAGNSAIAKSYQYQDAVSGYDYVYYRLRQVDNDGKSGLSNIVRLNMNEKAGGSLQLYPNPFQREFTASFTAERSGKATLQLINMKGQVVYTGSVSVVKGANSTQINNLPELQPGLYQVIIANEELKYMGRLQKL